MTKGLLLTLPLVVLLAAAPATAQAPSEDTPDATDTTATDEAPEAAPAEQILPAEVSLEGAGLEENSPEQISYDLQLHELEDRLNELKEDVYASKARLRMLWHQLMQERIGGSRIIIDHVNELGGVFDLVRVSYALDGNQIYATSTEEMANLPRRNRMEVHVAPVLAGPHTIVVQAEVRGNDHGMFSYMNEYSYTLVSSHSFTIDEGKTGEVDVIIYDHGGGQSLDDRLDVRYDVEIYDSVEEGVSVGESEGGDS